MVEKKKTGATQPLNVAIVTPTYNEAGNINKLLNSLKEVSSKHPKDNFSVFVIDDSSPDGTADIVKKRAPKLKSKNFNIDLITRKEKDGLGRAYIFGFGKVLDHETKFDYILQMDADLSHDPVYISHFIDHAKKGTDFIVATRYIEGGGTPDWPWYRQALSRGGNLYTRILLGSRITDYTGGFNMFKRSLMENMDVEKIEAGGYGFIIDLKHRALQEAATVAQIPIVFVDRQNGSSKIPKSTLIKNFILVLKIRMRS